MNFGKALKALKNDELVAREEWSGETFLFLTPENLEEYIYTSNLPESVVSYFESIDLEIVDHNSYICMKNADDKIISGWVPSQEDMLAIDWFIVELEVEVE